MGEELGVRGKLHFLGIADVIDVQKNYVNNERVNYFWVKTKQKIKFNKEELGGIKSVPLGKLGAFAKKNAVTPMFIAGMEFFYGKLATRTGNRKRKQIKRRK
jgi:hypothetical protein